MRAMNNNVLNGKRIVTQDGRVVGEIESLFIDVDTWRVTDLAVKVRKDVLEELKLKRPFIGTQIIRIPTEQISGTSDQVVLKPDFAKMTYEGGESEEEVDLQPLFGQPDDHKGKDEKGDKKS
jgi:sporulation protein YlmC with PRC-barrel domain